MPSRPRALASVLVCAGCCCGHTEKGKPAIPRARLEAAWSERQLEGTVRLRFVDCLGPCQPANLVVVKTAADESIWLAGLTSTDEYDALADWAEQSRAEHAPSALPATLADRQIPPPCDA